MYKGVMVSLACSVSISSSWARSCDVPLYSRWHVYPGGTKNSSPLKLVEEPNVRSRGRSTTQPTLIMIRKSHIIHKPLQRFSLGLHPPLPLQVCQLLVRGISLSDVSMVEQSWVVKAYPCSGSTAISLYAPF